MNYFPHVITIFMLLSLSAEAGGHSILRKRKKY